MRRTALLVLLQVLVAAAAIANVVLFELSNMMIPARAATGTLSMAAVVFAFAATIAMVFVARLRPVRWIWIACIAIVTFGASFAPHLADALERHQTKLRVGIEDRQIESAFLRDFDRWKSEVAARMPERRRLSPAESLDFLEFVNGADLSYRSLPDFSEEAVPLLQRALNARILDPNVRVRGRRPVDTAEEPLFLYFYRTRIASAKKASAIRVREWDLLQLLVVYGADMSDAAAADLRDDLRKTVVRNEPDGRFMRLQ